MAENVERAGAAAQRESALQKKKNAGGLRLQEKYNAVHGWEVATADASVN